MKVLCFGSLNVDMVFSVNEFVKPKETIHSNTLTYFAGGKGLNQAIALKKAQANVYIAGSIGRDGQLLIDTCRKNQLDLKYIRTIDSSSGMAVVQVDDKGENCIILHEGANAENSTAFMDCVLEDFQAGDMLVIQNEINNLDYLIDAAYQKKMKIVLNPSPVHEKLINIGLNKCSYLILNEVEGQALSGETQNELIVKKLHGKFDAQVILTVGKDGVYFNAGNEVIHVGAVSVGAIDTTGAGDTFTGFVIGEISKGKSVEDAVKLAVHAAALAVTKTGASDSIPEFSDVLAFMDNLNQ